MLSVDIMDMNFVKWIYHTMNIAESLFFSALRSIPIHFGICLCTVKSNMTQIQRLYLCTNIYFSPATFYSHIFIPQL